jgi:hypothetical protein
MILFNIRITINIYISLIIILKSWFGSLLPTLTPLKPIISICLGQGRQGMIRVRVAPVLMDALLVIYVGVCC